MGECERGWLGRFGQGGVHGGLRLVGLGGESGPGEILTREGPGGGPAENPFSSFQTLRDKG
jgi:hypothetical protein